MNANLKESSSFSSFGPDQTESVSRAPGSLQERPVGVGFGRETGENGENPSMEARFNSGATLDPSSQMNAQSISGERRAAAYGGEQLPAGWPTEASAKATQTGISRGAALDDLRDELGSVGGQTSTVTPQSRGA